MSTDMCNHNRESLSEAVPTVRQTMPSGSVLAKGAIWTIGGYCGIQALRFSTNVILTRLLAPELFGIMVIVNTIRTGAELMSDVGIAQCVIRSNQAENAKFYDTAWTLQVIRGSILFLICSILAVPIARLYGTPGLSIFIPVSAASFLIGGFTSVGPAILQKRMDLATLNTFELRNVIAFSAFQVTISFFYPTIWSLIVGLLFGTAYRALASFIFISGVSHRVAFCGEHARQIFRFGKWIGLSSALYFFSTSFDRLYLAGMVPLATLGIYGIARTIAEIVGASMVSLGNYVVFPFIAAHAHGSRATLRKKIASQRLSFLLLAAAGVAMLAGVVDILIRCAFDPRYHSAGWMTSVLILGVWFAILCAVNEATLLGLGKPSYGATANAAKLLWLAVGIPVGLTRFGIAGAIVVTATADVFRYVPILAGQIRERFCFLSQDLSATFVLAFVFGGCLWLRAHLGQAALF